jgi:hypothetical protein
MTAYPNFRDLERLSGITWADLTAREPGLGELLWEARQASVPCRRWSDVDQAFAPLRNSLANLVGFAGKHQGNPVLGSSDAYQVAYWKLYDAVAALLPGRTGRTEEAPEKQRTETVAEPCPTALAATTLAMA